MDEKSVRFLPAGGSRDRLAALVTGRISAATFDIPHSILAKKQGLRWLNSQSYWKPMTWNASVTTPRWAAANGDTVVRYLRAAHRAVDWMNDAANSDEATSILTRLSGFEASVVREVLKASREGGEYVPARPTAALFELPHEMLLKQEIVAKPIDLTRMIDASYYDRAFKGRRD